MTVGDASPLIVFAQAHRFSLLEELLTALIIPRAVHQEIVIEGHGRPGAEEVAQATWIEVADVADRALMRRLPRALGRGEREAIVLAQERHLALYSDDRRARIAAQAAGVAVFGTLGLLEVGKRTARLTEVKPIVDELQRAGLRLHPGLYQSWLHRLGE